MDARLFDAGILKSILLPNLAFSSSLVLPTYLLQRLELPISTTSFWTAATLGNVFWLAISPRLRNGAFGQALKSIPRSEWLLLGALGISATGFILNDLATSMTATDSGRPHDALYTNRRHDLSSWTRYLSDWGSKILAHTFITLPLMTPFRGVYPTIQSSPARPAGPYTCAITLWITAQVIIGLATLSSERDLGLKNSIRHPQSLGVFLESVAYPLYLYSQNLLHPLFALSPITTYLTLRARDGKMEHGLEDKLARDDPAQCVRLHEQWEVTNSFWPGLETLKSKWSWIVLAVGAGTAMGLQSGRMGLRR